MTEKEKKAAYAKAYYAKNKEKLKAYSRNFYRSMTPEQREQYDVNVANWKAANKERIAAMGRAWKEANKARIATYDRSYRKKAPIDKLVHTRRTRRTKLFSRSFARCSTVRDLGCSTRYWREWIEAKFRDGMTWENHGAVWHLDEVVPVCCWNLDNPEEWAACWHYTNSQPLLVRENLLKSKFPNHHFTEKLAQLATMKLLVG
jgi:hypothetical protein